MLNINYTQQYKLGKLLIVLILMLNINYTQQYKLGEVTCCLSIYMEY